MILNTGNRTDIPAFFSEWFFNRLDAGFVDVKNPYAEHSYWRYQINPQVVDVIVFCSKNPKPMLSKRVEMDKMLFSYKTFWYMSITPYGLDIEPNVPDITSSINTFKQLSNTIGKNAVGWRYDPILFGNGWDVSWHLKAFDDIAKCLSGYTDKVVISFLDMYQKIGKNAPFAMRPDDASQEFIVQEFVKIANSYGMELYVCHDSNPKFAALGANTNGCATINIINKETGLALKNKNKSKTRTGCNCVLNSDIGQYNTCLHRCAYCYANYDHNIAVNNYKCHDAQSSCIIGHVQPTDTIQQMKQISWK
jgi:hypothetical protein